MTPRRLALLALPAALVLGLAACGGDPADPETVTETVTADADAPAGTDGGTADGDAADDATERQVFAEDGARDARVDCAGGTVEISADGADVDVVGGCSTVLLTGHGTEVDVESSDLASLEISGNDARVDVDGHVEALVVSGHGARVDVESVTTVQVSGNGVRVSYESGDAPTVDDGGEGTSVVQD
ncbi:DUF3060 domain-containing protein [Cellulosimicrobium sp. PMB13]|uniref:DUF3060 domain-containing protein n=1 Tax=Cellulosimicrobium sp. PMB13 TaxID=3120158 RepID=UPI003F4C0F4E